MAEASTGRGSVPLFAAVFLSGWAGLIYEITWGRQFTLEAGSLMPGLSFLLAAYLGGLALGSWAARRRSARLASPLRAFAGLELATGGLALLALPAIEASRPLLGWLYRRQMEAGGSYAAPAAAWAGACILPAALAMGFSFPVLVEHLSRRGGGPGASAGWAYGVHTAGALGGALTAGFVLLPALGVRRTLACGAAGNLLAAMTARWLSRGDRRLPKEPSPVAPPGPARSRAVLAVALLGGLAALLDQVGWTRVLSLVLGSTTFGMTAILAAFLGGLALGGWLGARLADRLRGPAAALGWTYSFLAISSLAIMMALSRLPVWLVPLLAGAGPRGVPLVAVQVASAGAILLLPTTLLGAAYPLAARWLAAGNPSISGAAAEVYAAGSGGMVLGALAAGSGMIPGDGSRGALLLGAACGLAAAVVAWAAAVPRPRLVPAGGSVALIGLLFLTASASWDPGLLTSGPFLYASGYRAAAAGAGSVEAAIRGRGRVRFLREGPGGVVTVREGPGGFLSLQINGKSDASTGGDRVHQLLVAHLPASLVAVEGGDALLVGLASGISLGALERHPFRHIDCIELLPEVGEAAQLFASANGNAIADPRVRVLYADGRSHLRYSSATYDVIASQPTNPWVAGSAALYTRETFLAARRALRPGGAFCQWVQGYALYPDDLRSVVATFLSVFPQATLWEESPAGGDYFLVGRPDSDASLDLERLRQALRRPAVARELASAGIFGPEDLLARFVAGPTELAAFAAGALIQSEDRSALEFTAARAILAETIADQVRLLRRHRASPAPLLTDLRPDEPADREMLRRLRRRRAADRREERLLLSMRPPAGALGHPEFTLGVELLFAGLPRAATMHLQNAAKALPQEAEPLALLGMISLASGDPETARRALTEAARRAPEDLAVQGLLARLELEAGDVDQAAGRVRRLLRREQDNPELLNLAGAAAILQGSYREAIPLLRRAVAADPDLVEAWANLGVALRRTGEPRAAREAYRVALDRDPDNLDVRFNLGTALLASGDPAGAAREFATVTAADPGDAEARRLLQEAGESRAGAAGPAVPERP